MISVIFLFSQCEQRSVWNNYYPMWGPGSILQTMVCYSPTTQKSTYYPNNYISPSYYPFPYPLPNFVLLRFSASRNAGMRVAVLFVSAISTVFKKHDEGEQILCHHPSITLDVSLSVSPISRLNRIIHVQGVLCSTGLLYPLSFLLKLFSNLIKNMSSLHTAKIKIGFAQHW